MCQRYHTSQNVMKQTTWFTKGLRRGQSCICKVHFSVETNDLIYEGIATAISSLVNSMAISLRNKRPDLRRDCDIAFWKWTSGIFSQLWNKRPDLRRDCDDRWHGIKLSKSVVGETNDLIYEGIATSTSPFPFSGLSPLNRNKRPDLRRDCDRISWPPILNVIICDETNDLIYEGIATCSIFSPLESAKWNKRPDLRRDCDLEYFIINPP